jgi:hypothetical protein
MSAAASNPEKSLTSMAASRNAAIVHAGIVEVPTDVVLPSGAGVTVMLSGGRSEMIAVSDGGTAIRHARETGMDLAECDLRAVRRAAKAAGLDFGSGELFVQVPAGDLAWGISKVANATRDIAHVAVRAAQRRIARNFKAVVRQQLDRIFPTGIVTGRAAVPGVSARPHRFDYAVRLATGRQLTLDLPNPDPNTISSIVLRNLDVKRRNRPDLVQVIVWDDREQWTAENLAQLRLADVALVRGSALETALRELLGVNDSAGQPG